MDGRVFSYIESITQDLKPTGQILEIGAPRWSESLLSMPRLKGSTLISVNIQEYEGLAENSRFIKCSANDMRDHIESDSIDLVLCNAMLEHDKRPWQTAAEIRRVLKRGAHAIIGVPSFNDNDYLEKMGILDKKSAAELNGRSATLTYRVHARPDYWRFSGSGIECLFEGLTPVRVHVMLNPPRMISVFAKP
jgi:SAM-dependent methyltransferase